LAGVASIGMSGMNSGISISRFQILPKLHFVNSEARFYAMKTTNGFIGFSLLLLLISLNANAQTVNNGSVTGSPAGNNVITGGAAPGWSTVSFSPDLCDVVFGSYTGNSQVPRIASPDGGTWLGLASLGEAAQTTITGLTPGTQYTLRFCGANFGTGSLYNGTPANPVIAVVGVASVTVSIPQVANTWNPYQLTFTATATSHILRCSSSGGSSYASLDGFNLTGALCNPVILPAEFIRFEAKYEDCKVSLDWESPFSETAKDFEVQRSSDGELFETLEKLDAAGAHSGHWVDPFPLDDAYYRIRMYNETGRVAESPIIVASGECTRPQAIVVGNPVHDAAFAVLKFTSETTHTTLTIRDVNGRLIKIHDIDCIANAWNEFRIPVAGLPAGIYLLTTQEGAETKMVLQ
jgi:hypothetical protein